MSKPRLVSNQEFIRHLLRIRSLKFRFSSIAVHFTFLNQYYPPDAAPTGVMLEAVVNKLLQDGHEVTVLCASGGYAKQTGGAQNQNMESGDGASDSHQPLLHVVRVPALRLGRGSAVGKLLDYASYYFGVSLRLLLCKADVVVALTTPPYLSVLARLITKLRGGEHAHWVMDLYPDVMVAHGMFSESSWQAKFLSRLTRWGFGGKRCRVALSLGPDMSERVRKYLPEGRVSPWIPLWGGDCHGVPDVEKVQKLREHRGWDKGEMVLMYSGNMGLGHLFDEILGVLEGGAMGGGSMIAHDEISESSGPRVVFYGGGKRRGEVAQFVETYPDARVELHDYVDSCDLNIHLASADVHLVSLRPEWDGAMVPSKLQGIFAVGRPVIFIGSKTSSIGQWVLESGGGWVVAPGDCQALIVIIQEAMDTTERKRRGSMAYNFAQQHFQPQRNAGRVAEVLRSVGPICNRSTAYR